MLRPRMSLHSFMIVAKSALHSVPQSSGNVNLIIGNESADLDSMVSAIILAYIKSSSPKSPNSNESQLYIPILNIPAADVHLRPEFAALLPHADLDPSYLITLDDLPRPSNLKSSLPPDRTRWILVDHNALQGNLGEVYESRVCGVIDHHAEENKVPQNTGAEPRVIDKAASCTSLVVEYCEAAWNELTRNPSNLHGGHEHTSLFINELDSKAARLALGAILVDSVNLKAEHKVTKHDTEAIKFLESKLVSNPVDGNIYERTEFFNKINGAKSDIGQLALKDIFRKDYKQWTEGHGRKIGISSVVKPIQFLLNKAHGENPNADSEPLLIIANEFAQERGLAVFSIMSAYGDDSGFHRELLIWAIDPECINAVQEFAGWAEKELQVVPHRSSTILDEVHSTKTWRRVWIQNDLSKSRKKVAPSLREYVKNA